MISSIGDILAKMPVKDKVKEYALWKAWDNLVGSHISRNCQPDRIKDGILFLRVTSPVWAHQLQFMKAMMLEKINGSIGDGIVRDLRFQVAKIGQARKANLKPWEEVPLGQNTLLQINEQLSSVRDPELRRILTKLRTKEAQVKAWRDQRHKGASSVNSPS